MREKFGKLVLLEETDSGGLGNEFRAAKLGPAGLEKLVSIVRFGPWCLAMPTWLVVSWTRPSSLHSSRTRTS